VVQVDQFKAYLNLSPYSEEEIQERLPNIIGRLCEWIGARQMLPNRRGKMIPSELMLEYCRKPTGAPAKYFVGHVSYRVHRYFANELTLVFYNQESILQFTLYVEDMVRRSHNVGLPGIERPSDGFYRSLLEANDAFDQKRPVVKIQDRDKRIPELRSYLGEIQITPRGDPMTGIHPLYYTNELIEALDIFQQEFRFTLAPSLMEITGTTDDEDDGEYLLKYSNLRYLGIGHRRVHNSPQHGKDLLGPSPNYRQSTEYFGDRARRRNETRSLEERPDCSRTQGRYYIKPGGTYRAELILHRDFLRDYCEKHKAEDMVYLIRIAPWLYAEQTTTQKLQLTKLRDKRRLVRRIVPLLKGQSVRGQIHYLQEAGLTMKEIRPFLKKIDGFELLLDIDRESHKDIFDAVYNQSLRSHN